MGTKGSLCPNIQKVIHRSRARVCSGMPQTRGQLIVEDLAVCPRPHSRSSVSSSLPLQDVRTVSRWRRWRRVVFAALTALEQPVDNGCSRTRYEATAGPSVFRRDFTGFLSPVTSALAGCSTSDEFARSDAAAHASHDSLGRSRLGKECSSSKTSTRGSDSPTHYPTQPSCLGR
jgi:hypothetical protein